MKVFTKNIPLPENISAPTEPVEIVCYTVHFSLTEVNQLGLMEFLGRVSYQEMYLLQNESYFNRMVRYNICRQVGRDFCARVFRALSSHGIINPILPDFSIPCFKVYPKTYADDNDAFLSVAITFVLTEKSLWDDELIRSLNERDCSFCTEKEIALTVRQNSIRHNNSEDKKLTPQMIKQHLDMCVISQDGVKETMAVAIYNHIKRVRYLEDSGDSAVVVPKKSNILIMGPTGSGKTETVNAAAEILDAPIVKVSAATLTASGYVGDNVSTIFANLYLAAGCDIEKAERGIVFIDEIDKIAAAPDAHIQRDVGGKSVQYELLRALEGEKMMFKPDITAPNIEMNTQNILFICAGAFADMEPEDMDKSSDLTKKLINYGLIPELVGRLPVIVRTNPLTLNDLVRILTEPQNALLKQYQLMFELDGVNLSFDEDAVIAVANKALELGTGARGLQGIVESTLRPLMYNIPDMKGASSVNITKDYVEGKCKASFNDGAYLPDERKKVIKGGF